MQIVVNIRFKYQISCLFEFWIKNLPQRNSQIQTLSDTEFWNSNAFTLIYYKKHLYEQIHRSALKLNN